MQLIKSPISNQQRGMIYGLAKDLNISNEQLHEHMLDWCGLKSLKSDSCSKANADIIIDSLQKMKSSKVGGKACLPQSKPGFATVKQLKLINQLMQHKKWNEQHLLNFISHTTGKLAVSELTMKEASAVITGLKKI